MSLEDVLNRNNDLLERNNALLEKLVSGSPKADVAKPVAAKPAAAKPAAVAVKPAVGKKVESKAPSITLLAERFGAYMKNVATRDDAMANVRAVVAHFGAPKLTEIDAKHFPKLLEYLDAWEAGEVVEFEEIDGDEGDGDGGDALI